MKISIQSLFLPLLATVALFGASSAFASDLSQDLRTPFEPLSNPFGRAQTSPLPAAVASELKGLLERCAFNPVNTRSAIVMENEASLVDGCEALLTPTYEIDSRGVRIVSHTLTANVSVGSLQVVAWDGSDSDGGDELALGVYDAGGNRIATYTGLFVDGNVIDGIAHAVGAMLPRIER